MSDAITPDVFEETHPKAAKPYRCCECYNEIPKGQTYQKVKGLWDGSWGTFRTCEACEEQRDNYYREVGESAPFGDLREWCFNSDIKFWKDTDEDAE